MALSDLEAQNKGKEVLLAFRKDACPALQHDCDFDYESAKIATHRTRHQQTQVSVSWSVFRKLPTEIYFYNTNFPHQHDI